MHDYKVILTWEAIYDVTDIADYIEAEFGPVSYTHLTLPTNREV